MRVVFLYTSYGSGDGPWDPTVESKNHFLGEHGLPTEGYFAMLLRLKEIGVIDDAAHDRLASAVNKVILNTAGEAISFVRVCPL